MKMLRVLAVGAVAVALLVLVLAGSVLGQSGYTVLGKSVMVGTNGVVNLPAGFWTNNVVAGGSNVVVGADGSGRLVVDVDANALTQTLLRGERVTLGTVLDVVTPERILATVHVTGDDSPSFAAGIYYRRTDPLPTELAGADPAPGKVWSLDNVDGEYSVHVYYDQTREEWVVSTSGIGITVAVGYFVSSDPVETDFWAVQWTISPWFAAYPGHENDTFATVPISPTGMLEVNGAIVPLTGSMFDLGTAETPWRSLYLDGNTLHIGGFPISVDTSSGSLSFGGVVVASTNEASLVTEEYLALQATQEVAYAATLTNMFSGTNMTSGSDPVTWTPVTISTNSVGFDTNGLPSFSSNVYWTVDEGGALVQTNVFVPYVPSVETNALVLTNTISFNYTYTNGW